ncbi:MAG: peptidoglycan DD-metalloendopeptidase family protein [bacterium]|nr:peptidoglycan DD-metalloendopeptidase family protein [bacterium]
MIFSKHYSIILSDHSGGNVFSIFIHRWVARAMVFFLLCLVIGLIAVSIFGYKNYRAMAAIVLPTYENNLALAKENIGLRKEMDKKEKEIEDLEFQVFQERENYAASLEALYSQVKKLDKFYTDLKIMAGFKLEADKARKLNAPKTGKKLGTGGPTMSDDEFFESLLILENEKFIKEGYRREGMLNKRCTEFEKEFRLLKRMLEKRKSLLADVPDMSPCKGTITSYYGASRGGRVHTGLDIANEIGTPLVAPADGVVTFAGTRSTYGKVIYLDHGHGFTSRYGHLSGFNISVGDRVIRGEVIGYMGRTGYATGSHVHWEVRLNGIPVDPINYLGDDKLPIQIVDGSALITIEIPEGVNITLDKLEPTNEGAPEPPK